MTLASGIEELRRNQFSNDEILKNIRQLRPDLNQGIDTLYKEGFSEDEILDNIAKLQLEPRKLGKLESVGAGATEGILGPVYLGELAGSGSKSLMESIGLGSEKPEFIRTPEETQANLMEKPFSQMSFAELHQLADSDDIDPFFSQFSLSNQQRQEVKDRGIDQSSMIETILSNIPKSEDEASRRLRTGTSAVVGSIPFGILGMLAGLVGSQAGQTVRETFGEDGEFESPLGEALAIGTDIITGGAAAAGYEISRGSQQAARQATRMPAVFERGEDLLSKASAKAIIQGEREGLENAIKQVSTRQIKGFENQASRIAPISFETLPQRSAGEISTLQRAADDAFRNTQLATISPISISLEEGSRAIQTQAKKIFKETVIDAERQSYNAAKESAATTSGSAPRSLQQAKELEEQLTRVTPQPEQNPVISYLRGLINDLEEKVSDSLILGAEGRPIQRATTRPKNLSGDDLIQLVQNGNQAVNYESAFREQSHRLKPLINTLREETGKVLSTNSQANQLYQQANALHGKNAEIWGTKYMRNVMFGENPESIVQGAKKASNMRNFKQAIKDIEQQALLERLTIQNITESGGEASNRAAIEKLSPALSENAKTAANTIINVKDPLTTTGGKAALRNSIMKDVAGAIQSGQKPAQALELMKTPKGLQAVRESFRGSRQGQEIMNSLERLFIEDLFQSVIDQSGQIDFKKAQNILANPELAQSIRMIGGDKMVRGFQELETMAKNLQTNIAKYSSGSQKSVLQAVTNEIKNQGAVGLVLHSLFHLPWPILAGISLMRTGWNASSIVGRKLLSMVMRNENIVNTLRQLSLSKTATDAGKQITRLSAQIGKLLQNIGEEEEED